MASRSRPLETSELESPDTGAAIRRTMSGYSAALASLPGNLAEQNAQLMAMLTSINAALEEQARTSLTSELLSELRRTIDQPVLRSPLTEMPSQWPEDRGRPASYRPPGALELLASSPRAGQRVVGKLLLADARRRGTR